METKDHSVGPASCRVRRSLAFPAHMRDGIREVTKVYTPPEHRKQGYATTLMHKVCREADAAGIVLALWPAKYSDGDIDTGALQAWYAREFGFVVIQPEPILMARQPGGTPKVLALKPAASAAHEAMHGRI